MLEIIALVSAAALAILWLSTLYLYLKLKKRPKEMTIEAQQLLSDVMSSGAVVRIEVLDPRNLLYHRR